jgi:hypothetical protein
MPYVNVEVDLDDIYDELSSWDKNELAEKLAKDGHCILEAEDYEDEFKIENPNVLDEMWCDIVKKLFHGRIQLSLEDEETITKIANKL